MTEESPLTGQEVADILRRLARGEVTARLLDSRNNWEDVYAGDVGFNIGGYEIVVFNDCDELDYVDSARTPDGRVGDFDDWADSDEEPVQLLSEEERTLVYEKLKTAGG